MQSVSLSRAARAAQKTGWLLLCGAALQLAGCATVGQEFAASRVPEIKIGQSTRQNIKDIFGSPWRTGLEDGKPTWTYGIYKYSVFSPDDTQDLLIRFDNNGIVRSFTFNTTRK